MKKEPDYDLVKFSKKLQKYIDTKRFYHTLGVEFTAASLAMVHDVDINKAQTAGLLHDAAKRIPDEEKIRLCKKKGIPVSELEKRNPFLLHTKLGAWLAKDKYGVEDPEILSAIRYHTTGKPGMTKLEQIIFIADYIEPRRDKAKALPEIRKAAFKNLDEATYLELKDMLEYLQSKKDTEIDPMTQEAFDYYRKLNMESEEPDKTEMSKTSGTRQAETEYNTNKTEIPAKKDKAEKKSKTDKTEKTDKAAKINKEEKTDKTDKRTKTVKNHKTVGKGHKVDKR